MSLHSTLKGRAAGQASANTETRLGTVKAIYTDSNNNVYAADVQLTGIVQVLSRVPNSSTVRLYKGALVTVNFQRGNRFTPNILGLAGADAGAVVTSNAAAAATLLNDASTGSQTADLSGLSLFMADADPESVPDGFILVPGANVLFTDTQPEDSSGGRLPGQRVIDVVPLVVTSLPDPSTTTLPDGTLLDLISAVDASPVGMYRLDRSVPIWRRRDVGAAAWLAVAAWSTFTSYTVGPPASVVTYGGETYVCSTSHISTGVFDATKWTLIAQKGADGTDGVDGLPGGPVAITYSFDSSTASGDPGSGHLRLNNATQGSATSLYASNTDALTVGVAAILGNLAASTSAIKGQVRLVKKSDATKWMLFNVVNATSAVNSYTIQVTFVAQSGANPFTNGDALLFFFGPTGDKGDPGTPGATGSTGTTWMPAFTAPVDSAFSWLNRGSGGNQATVTVESSGAIVLFGPATAGDNNPRIRVKSVPAAQYTLTIGFMPSYQVDPFLRGGFGIRDSSTGKMVLTSYGSSGSGTFEVYRQHMFADYSSLNDTSGIQNAVQYIFTSGILWFRVQDDGTNRIWSLSNDGRTFWVAETQSRTLWATGDQLLFFVGPSRSKAAGITLLHWSETTP